MTWAKTLAVLKIIATSRVTYRFLAVLLASLGIAQGGSIASAVETGACLLLGGCM